MIGEGRVESGLKALGKNVPDTVGRPMTVREMCREGGRQGVCFEPFVKPEESGVPLTNANPHKGSKPREVFMNGVVKEID
jgi:hypothetical protein